MTNYTFTTGATQAFVYTTDTLTFPAGTDLTSVTIAANASNAANTDITVGSQRMTLTGVTVANLVATPAALLVGTAGGELFWGTSSADSITGTAYADAIYGLAGQDTLLGMAGNDTIFGGSGKADTTDIGDSIDGGAGSDLIYGNAGLDTITGTAGNDTVYGGGQNDSIDYSASSDAVIIYGGGGAGNADNDTIKGSTGNDTLYGGSGMNDTADGGDTIYGEGGADLIYGNAGADSIIGSNNGGADTVYAGLGDDTVNYSAETTSTGILIYGDAGNDSLTGGAGNDTIYGGNGAVDATDLNDTIDGGTGNDLIYGNAGADSIVGSNANSGNDTVYGGAGADTIDYHASTNTTSYQQIYGGEGNDSIIGSYGPDVIYGADGTVAGATAGIVYSVGEDSTGSNTIDGQAGNDTIYGGNGGDSITSASNTSAGVDVVYGLGGADTIDYSTSTVAGSSLYGGLGGDTINGSAYADYIVGGSSTNDTTDGADSITGNGGNDTVYGNSGNDTIVTGSGADLIYAGSGNDSITPGSGADSVYGDEGNDVVVVTSTASWPGVTIMGGSATSDTSAADSLTFQTTSNNITAASLAGIHGFEVFVTAGATSADTITVNDTYALTLTAVNGTRTLSNAYTAAQTVAMKFDASALTAASATNVSLAGGTGADTLLGGAGADTLIGNNGANSITGGLGADSMTGGTGNDTFFFAAADFAQGNDSISASTGTDAVTFTDTDIGTITAVSSFANMSGVDAVNFHGTTNTHNVAIPTSLVMNSDSKLVAFNYANAQSGSVVFDASAVVSTSAGIKFNNVGGNISGTSTVTGTAGADSIIGSSAANVINGGGGADTITGGAAADVINIPSTSFTATGAVITGNGGTDTLTFTDNAVLTANGAVFTHVLPLSDIAVINLASGGYAHSVTANAYGATLVIQPNPTASTAQSGAMSIDASSIGHAVTIIGGTGADTILAGTSGSSIVGGGGADSITGGAGADLIVISGMTELNALATVPLATVNGAGGAADTVRLNDTVAVVLSDSSSQLAHMTAVENLLLPSGAYAHNIVLTSTHGATTSFTVSPSTPASQTTGMTLNGASDADGGVTLVLVGGAGADVITGSSTVASSLTGSGGADTITGGSGADTITGGANAETIYGYGGADTITAAGGDDAVYLDHAAVTSAAADVYRFSITNTTATDYLNVVYGDVVYNYNPGTTMVDLAGGGTLKDGQGNTSAALASYSGVADTLGFKDNYASVDLTAIGASKWVVEIDPGTATFAPGGGIYSQANLDTWGAATFTAGKLTAGTTHPTDLIIIAYSSAVASGTANAAVMELIHAGTNASTAYTAGDLHMIGLISGLTLDGSSHGPLASADFV